MLVVDLNESDEAGIDFATVFTGSATAITDTDAILTDVDGGVIGTATAGNGDIFVVSPILRRGRTLPATATKHSGPNRPVNQTARNQPRV